MAPAGLVPPVPSVHQTEGMKLARWAFFSLLAAAIPMAIAGEVRSGYLWALATGCSAVALFAVHTVSPELARERYHPPNPGLDGTTLRWAFVPGNVLVGFAFRRVVVEDRFLAAHLPGYREYAARVRYRLLPGIW